MIPYSSSEEGKCTQDEKKTVIPARPIELSSAEESGDDTEEN